MAVIHVSGFRKTCGSTVAVDDVSFNVNAGEIFGLIGDDRNWGLPTRPSDGAGGGFVARKGGTRPGGGVRLAERTLR